MGLLLMLEGFSRFSPCEEAGQRSGHGLAIVLAGPAGIQKSAQADFLKRRYGLHTMDAVDLRREIARSRTRRFLLEGCAASPREATCLSTLAGHRDLPPPVFIEIADRRLEHSSWDVDLIQTYYPDADVWTLDGTRPREAVSETLQRLLDGQAGR